MQCGHKSARQNIAHSIRMYNYSTAAGRSEQFVVEGKTACQGAVHAVYAPTQLQWPPQPSIIICCTLIPMCDDIALPMVVLLS